MTGRVTRRELMALAGALALPPGLVRGQGAGAVVPPPAAPPPDLANLHGVVSWLSAQHKPALSFLESRFESIEDWKRTARPVYAEHLRYDPPARPPGADVLAREERDGFRVETVR